MHVIIATDGSKQSLRAARYFKTFADKEKITEISVLAVTRPLASLPFIDEISQGAKAPVAMEKQAFRAAAAAAVDVVAAEFADWQDTVVRKKIRSGTPSTEIVRAAVAAEAELVVMASGSRGLSEAVLMGSTAQRVQYAAPCPVLVVRPTPRRKRKISKAAKGSTAAS